MSSQNFFALVQNSNLLLCFAFVSVFVLLLLGVLCYVGKWHLLQRAARHDIAALVPFYNKYELARAAGVSAGMACIYVGISIVFYISTFLLIIYSYLILFSGNVSLQSYSFGSTSLFVNNFDFVAFFQQLWSVVSSVCLLLLASLLLAPTNFPLLFPLIFLGALSIVFRFYISCGLARSFKHGLPFMLGLVFLPCIFFPVLSLSKSHPYLGPYFDKYGNYGSSFPWEDTTKARKAAFGYNGPLVLSLFALSIAMLICVFPQIIFAIIAICISILSLVLNTSEKQKPLAHAKYNCTKFMSIFTIALSVILVLLLMLFHGYFDGFISMFNTN